MKLRQLSSVTLLLLLSACGSVAPSLKSSAVAEAATERIAVVRSWSGSDGAAPQTGLLSIGDGFFYGTTSEGGGKELGSIFKINPIDGSYTLLHSFTGKADGSIPFAGLTPGRDGYLYGTTFTGGAAGRGTIFRINLANNALNTVYSFTGGADGASPFANLIFDGTSFYGTALLGGSNLAGGTLYKVDSTGNFTLLHSFNGTDGLAPAAGLVLASNGYLYGTSSAGGTTRSAGTVFRIKPDGSDYSVLHSFTSLDGASPLAGLVLGKDGYFYGATSTGGDHENGTLFKINLDGTQFAVLHSFGPLPDGKASQSVLVQGQDGFFYGTTVEGGTHNRGTVFRINSTGSDYSVLHSFNSQDGQGPSAGLVLFSDGHLYGTTLSGGTLNHGAFFRY